MDQCNLYDLKYIQNQPNSVNQCRLLMYASHCVIAGDSRNLAWLHADHWRCRNLKNSATKLWKICDHRVMWHSICDSAILVIAGQCSLAGHCRSQSNQFEWVNALNPFRVLGETLSFAPVTDLCQSMRKFSDSVALCWFWCCEVVRESQWHSVTLKTHTVSESDSETVRVTQHLVCRSFSHKTCGGLVSF